MRITGLVLLLLSPGRMAQRNCGAPGDSISIAGSTTAEPLSRIWAEAFATECPSLNINVGGGGSSEGARQVCGVKVEGEQDPTDIGTMSRDWHLPDEATTSNGWKYECEIGDQSRSFTQVLIAYDGLTFSVGRNSSAEACIASLPGGGLTTNQLRWMFSSYSEDSLVLTGWDANSIVESDGNDLTRLWSELGGSSVGACSNMPIEVSGADLDSGTQYWFHKTIFQDGENGETFRAGYDDNSVDANTIAFVQADGNAIGYTGYVHALANADTVNAVSIYNPNMGVFVAPTPDTIFKNQYQPFTRPIFMNVADRVDAKDQINAFMEFGFSDDGDRMIAEAGYVHTTPTEKAVMLTRLQAEGGIPMSWITCGDNAGSLQFAGSTNVYPIARLWADVYNVFCDVDILVQSGGSSAGARRVCNQGRQDESAVDIGGMSRNWDVPKEGETFNQWQYDCAETKRQVTQIDVAIDGLSLVTSVEGSAYSCIRAMGGLSVEQLRWIFSNLSDSELVARGWPMDIALPKSDGDEKTHFWSELADTPACRRVEIKIAGQDEDSGTFQFMADSIFEAEGEGFDLSRNYFAPRRSIDLVEFVESNPESIAFFGHSNVIDKLDRLQPVPILNPDTETFVLPDVEHIESGLYSPLSRRLFMNILDEPSSLRHTRPFINFGLSAGVQLIPLLGLSRIPSWSATVMHTRLQTALGVKHDLIVAEGCGPGGKVAIAGSSTVLPVARLWAAIYEIGCNTTFTIEGGGSSAGASRVCGNLDEGEAVEIGNMSREWKDTEGVSRDSFLYQCRKGDTSRSVGQVKIAVDGLTVAVAKGGSADKCLAILGGLTLDQLRWMYTDISSEDLEADPTWDKSSVPHSDGLDYTHLWNELHIDCDASEILIAGADEESGTYEFFKDTVFAVSDESFDLARPAPYFNSDADEDLVSYLQTNKAGVAFFGYSYYFDRRDILVSADIKNKNGNFVEPNEQTIRDKTYPFSRSIYMNVLNDKESLMQTIPFLKFGFSEEGDNLVLSTGLNSAFDSVKSNALKQLEDMYAAEVEGDHSWASASAIVGIVVVAIVVAALIALCLKLYVCAHDDKSTKPGEQEEPRV